MASGVLRGYGKQRIGAIVNFIGYYILGLPIAGFTAFYLEVITYYFIYSILFLLLILLLLLLLLLFIKWGLAGLWVGLLVGSLFSFISFLITIRRTDWQEV